MYRNKQNKLRTARQFLYWMLMVLLSVSVGHAELRHDPVQAHELTFGFLPAESPVALFRRFAPLRDYLADELKQNIRMETAKNFREYVLRTDERRYDIIFTAPHMVLRALDRDQYEVIATFSKPLKAVLVTRKTASFQNPLELNGKIIATPPKRAIVTMVGKQHLEQLGVQNLTYRDYRTHNAAFGAVLGGEADAALIANFIYIKESKKNNQLRLISRSVQMPGMGVLVARDLTDEIKQGLQKTLVNMDSQPKGRTVLKSVSHPGYRAANRQDFEVIRPYINSKVQAPAFE